MDFAAAKDLDDQKKWDRFFLITISLVFAWRLLFVLIAPLDLVPDEAYYWDWSRKLALGYFSKPPMIAWINALSSFLLTPSSFSVRLPAVLFGVLSLLAIFALARTLFDSRVAFWSVVAVVVSPGNSVLNFIMTIDAPLLCFWTIFLYTFLRSVGEKRGGWKWWGVSAVIIGLGLLSKQMMIVAILLGFIFLLQDSELRSLLRTGKPYLWAFVALLFLLPPIYWNFKHGWITFQHTSGHFSANPVKEYNFMVTSSAFLAGQFLLISPVSAFLFFVVNGKLLFTMKSQPRSIRYLLVFGILSLCGFLIMSFRQGLNPNWPAIFYPAGMIVLSAWACGSFSCGEKLDGLRRFFIPGLVLGACMAALVYILPFVLAVYGGGKNDPTARLKGWQEMGRVVSEIRREMPDSAKVFLLSNNRQFVSELAFYAEGQQEVFRWRDTKEIIDCQYDLWPGPVDRIGWDGLLVLPINTRPAEALAGSFEAVSFLGDHSVELGKNGQRQFSLFLGTNLLKWPY